LTVRLVKQDTAALKSTENLVKMKYTAIVCSKINHDKNR